MNPVSFPAQYNNTITEKDCLENYLEIAWINCKCFGSHIVYLHKGFRRKRDCINDFGKSEW